MACCGFFAPSFLFFFGTLFGLTVTVEDFGGEQLPHFTTLGWLLQPVNFGVGLWGLIELGMLRGTVGSNAHGPDPLAR